MDDDSITPIRPRRIRRSGFKASTVTEGARVSEDDSAIEGVVEPAVNEPSLHDQVRNIARRPVARLPDNGYIRPNQNEVDKILRGARQSDALGQELRLQAVNRMILEGADNLDIAERLNIPINSVYRLRSKLKERYREVSKELTIEAIVGKDLGFYEHVQAQALQLAADPHTTTPMKLASLRTSLGANADKHRFLTNAGVYDVLRFKQSESSQEQNDVEKLVAATRRIFGEGFGAGESNSGTDEEIEL